MTKTREEDWKKYNSKQVFELHGFSYWLAGLQSGSWALPVRVPRAFLLGFDKPDAVITRRCEDCRCGLGNAVVSVICPVCGGNNISQRMMNCGNPWEYFALPDNRWRLRR